MKESISRQKEKHIEKIDSGTTNLRKIVSSEDIQEITESNFSEEKSFDKLEEENRFLRQIIAEMIGNRALGFQNTPNGEDVGDSRLTFGQTFTREDEIQMNTIDELI